MPKRSREESPRPASSGQKISGSTSAAAEHQDKYVQTPVQRLANMKCSLPPHAEVLSFGTCAEFETHYSKVHSNRCAECKRNFPTEHFLMLHITENHDPLNEARKAKGEKTVRRSLPGFSGGS